MLGRRHLAASLHLRTVQGSCRSLRLSSCLHELLARVCQNKKYIYGTGGTVCACCKPGTAKNLGSRREERRSNNKLSRVYTFRSFDVSSKKVHYFQNTYFLIISYYNFHDRTKIGIVEGLFYSVFVFTAKAFGCEISETNTVSQSTIIAIK